MPKLPEPKPVQAPAAKPLVVGKPMPLVKRVWVPTPKQPQPEPADQPGQPTKTHQARTGVVSRFHLGCGCPKGERCLRDPGEPPAKPPKADFLRDSRGWWFWWNGVAYGTYADREEAETDRAGLERSGGAS